MREVVRATLAKIEQHASPDELRRQCALVSMAFCIMLERQGVWCAVVRGSTRFTFPSKSKISRRYFYIDDPSASDDGAGHARMIAPPFKIIDLTARYQGWQAHEADYLPQWIVVENARTLPPESDLFVRDARPPFHPELRALWRDFPPVEIRAKDTIIRYQPGGISAPLEGLDESALTIGGIQANEFFELHVRAQK